MKLGNNISHDENEFAGLYVNNYRSLKGTVSHQILKPTRNDLNVSLYSYKKRQFYDFRRKII